MSVSLLKTSGWVGETLLQIQQSRKNAEKLNLLSSFHHVISAQQQKKIQEDGHAITGLVTPCLDTETLGHEDLLLPLSSETKDFKTPDNRYRCH